jgi:hypothetical protein
MGTAGLICVSNCRDVTSKKEAASITKLDPERHPQAWRSYRSGKRVYKRQLAKSGSA